MYPLVPPPATDVGALTWPRRLQIWLDDNPITRLTRASTFIQLPVFNQGNNTWNGYSDIVAAFNFEGPNNISLKPFVVPVSPNYACTIAYRVGTVVTRYLLWNATGSLLPGTITPYTNQVVLKNFRLEIWNTSQGAASEVNGVTFYTSKLQGFDYRYNQDSSLVVADAESTSFGCNDLVNIPFTLNITNAGQATCHGTYNYTTIFSGKPYYVGGTNTSIFSAGPSNWIIADNVLGTDYQSNQNVLSPDLVTIWNNGVNGSNPAPTVTPSNYLPLYTLPLTFPVGSYSTTN